MLLRSVLAAMLLLTTSAAAQQATPLVRSLEALASRGNPEATYHFGMVYQTGSGGMTLDHRKALGYFRNAAEAGDPLAAYKLGCFYAGQDDVLPRDEAAALRYKLVAARAGYALAQQDVAGLYLERGDTAAAGEWIGRAAAQGTSGALMGMAALHNGENGLPRDGAIVTAYFRLFLRTQDGGTDEQRQWLAREEATLTEAGRARAQAIVTRFSPAPTPLTIKALSGIAAAEQLVRNRRP